jgi:hypothetical protein
MEMGMEEGSLRLSATRTARKRHSATVLKRKLAGRFGGSPDYVWDTGEVPRSRALSLKCRLQRQARTPLAHPSGRFVHRMPSSRREGLRLFEDLVQRTALWLCSGTGQRLTCGDAGPRRIT